VLQRAVSAQFNNCLLNAVQDNKLSEHATQLAAVGVVDMSSLEQLCESASAVEVWQQTDLRSCRGVAHWRPCFGPKPFTLYCPPPLFL
jgi:hypothetical protein